MIFRLGTKIGNMLKHFESVHKEILFESLKMPRFYLLCGCMQVA